MTYRPVFPNVPGKPLMREQPTDQQRSEAVTSWKWKEFADRYEKDQQTIAELRAEVSRIYDWGNMRINQMQDEKVQREAIIAELRAEVERLHDVAKLVSAGYSGQCQQYRKQIAERDATIAELRAEVASWPDRYDAQYRQLNAANMANDNADKQIVALQARVVELEAVILSWASNITQDMQLCPAEHDLLAVARRLTPTNAIDD